MPKVRLTTVLLVCFTVFGICYLFKACKCNCGRSEDDTKFSKLQDAYNNLEKKSKDDSIASAKEISHYDFNYKALKQKDSAHTFERANLLAQLSVWANRSKSRLAIIEELKNKKDTSSWVIVCDSISTEYQNYIFLTDRERLIADSLLAVKDAEIANRDSLVDYSIEQYNRCRKLFNTSLEIGGAFMQLAVKNKPRNVISVLGAAQVNTQLDYWAVGGGISIKNKRGYTLAIVTLLDNKTNTNFQLTLGHPIKLHK